MTDTVVFLAVGLFAITILFELPLIAWIRLGGHPEGTYRIFRIKYFSPIFIDAEKTPRRFILRMVAIKTGAPELPPYFEYRGFANGVGRYYLDPTNQTRHTGRMSQYYYPDNPFPIPMLTMARNPLMSAESLEKAFNDESVLDFLKVGKERKKSSSNRNLYLAIAAFIIVVVAGLAFLVRPH
jgi:hypothetical protein